MSFVRCRQKYEIKFVRDETFANTSDHVTIRREIPARKHFLKFSDDTVKSMNKVGEFLLIDPGYHVAPFEN